MAAIGTEVVKMALMWVRTSKIHTNLSEVL